MIQLTQQQRQELNEREPIAVDPETNEQYVLVRKGAYERMRRLFDEDVLATGELVDRILAEDDAKDPYLESYQSITRESQP